jgi:LPXTG-motif cell wall-anchored protein
MQNKNLYYVLGGVVAIGLVYFLTKKKKEDVVVNLNPPMEMDDEDSTSNTDTNVVSILDKIKEIIQEIKNKNLATPTTNP